MVSNEQSVPDYVDMSDIRVTSEGNWSEIHGKQKTFRVTENADRLQFSASSVFDMVVLRGEIPCIHYWYEM